MKFTAGTAYTDCSGDLSLRKRPGVWVLIEIEIVKVKTDKKEKKKKDKDEEKDVVSVKPFSDVSSQQETLDDDSRSRSGSLSQRMANLAKQSGGAQVTMLASSISPSKESPTGSSDDFEKQKKQQQEDFDRSMELQRRAQEQELEKQKLDHERQQLELEKQRQQQQQQQIALVEGQEARSYYVPSTSAASYVREHQQQQGPKEDFVVHFTTLQQTILSLQTSVMGIHSKIDGLMTTNKESSSNAEAGGATAALLQQMQLMQQQQQMASMFNPNAMYGNQMGTQMGNQMGNHMGNQMGNQMGNHMGNQMGNNMGNHMGGQMNGQVQGQMQSQSAGPPLKGSELVEGVKALVDDCARHEQDLLVLRQQGSGGGGRNSNEQHVAKLEEKIETLMVSSHNEVNVAVVFNCACSYDSDRLRTTG